MYSLNLRAISSFLILVFLLLGSSACNLPGQSQEPVNIEEGAASTIAAQTVEAQRLQYTRLAREALQTAQTPTQTAPPTPTPTNIPAVLRTPIPATITLTPTLPFPTITLFAPTLESTTSLPTIIALIDTNCRSGPGKIFPRLGYLLAGEESTVYARTETSTWYYIANLDKPGEFCWVWSESTAINGDTAGLPVVTAIPTPQIADYSAAFSNLHTCKGNPTLLFSVENTGSESFFSASITIRDVAKDKTIAGPVESDTAFLAHASDCPPGYDELKAEIAGFIAIDLDSVLPSGTRTRALITLCTEADLEGTCVEKKVTFDFP
jgi:hypothetical protein